MSQHLIDILKNKNKLYRIQSINHQIIFILLPFYIYIILSSLRYFYFLKDLFIPA